jgi:hypothetical protein
MNIIPQACLSLSNKKDVLHIDIIQLYLPHPWWQHRFKNVKSITLTNMQNVNFDTVTQLIYQIVQNW